jgi:putative iron-regulated protein
MGVRNVYLGRYVRVDGSVVEGPSVSDLVAEVDPSLDAGLRGALDQTMMALAGIKTVGEAGTHYDQLLATGNTAGEDLVMEAVDALVAQTREIERAVSALGLSQIAFEGSDSLDDPDAVFQ